MNVSKLAPRVRAKNAGPFRLTIDCFCDSDAAYRQLSTALSSEVVAAAFALPVAQLQRFELDTLNVLKFSLPRPLVQGGVGDRDQHGAQWARVIEALPLP